MSEHIPDKLAQTLEPSRPIYALAAHSDDIIWSIGGWLMALAHNGYNVTLVTLFSHSSHLLAGERPPAEATKVRKQEDREAANAAGFRDVVFLDFPDAILRDRPDDKVLHPTYTTPPHLLKLIVETLRQTIPESAVILAPAGFGGHVDHLTTRRAALELPQPKVFYQDLPYGARVQDSGELAAFLRNGLAETVVPLDHATIEKHIALSKLYASQINEPVVQELTTQLSGGLHLWTAST